MKQLQLIQILPINAESAAMLRVVAANVPAINRTRLRSNASKLAAENADAASHARKSAVAAALRFTAR
ncbi:hypothetical protein [Bradyrhizobium sp. AZCC 2289]|uniref:hypothetical protein n=1 Tax=Bradyrhizobium sp. AZCC 2289 TaxID=3117026 RepID=UPI002FF2490F